jgi:hypothetical protein
MSDSVKTVTLVCGSPKAKKDQIVSEYLIDLEQTHIARKDVAVHRVSARGSLLRGTCEADFQTMAESDALIITFPLYFFCLPGLLMRFLQDYTAFLKGFGQRKRAKVYAVVNCGFPEAGINEEAVRVIKSFSKAIGAEYRFSLLLGGGGMILGTKDARFMRSTIDSIAAVFGQMRDDVLSDSPFSPQDASIEMHFPKKLYFFMGNLGWYGMAKRRHSLRPADLKKRPYRD